MWKIVWQILGKENQALSYNHECSLRLVRIDLLCTKSVIKIISTTIDGSVWYLDKQEWSTMSITQLCITMNKYVYMKTAKSIIIYIGDAAYIQYGWNIGF